MSGVFPQKNPDLELGSAVYTLLNFPWSWVHRRVETIQFLSAEAVRRRISVDLTLQGTKGTALVPLALLVKQPLVSLDVWDQSDQRRSVLTKQQNGYVAWSVLCSQAQAELDPSRLPLSIQTDLRKLATAGSESGRKLLEDFASPQAADSDQRQLLMASDSFSALVNELVENFLLLIPDVEVAKRIILKFAYDESFGPPESRWDRLAQQLGWRYTSFDFLVPATGEGDSYHLEVEAPAELEIDEALFFVDVEDQEVSVTAGRIVGQRVHLYAERHPPSAIGLGSVWLKQPRPGLLRLSLLSALMTAGALTFYFVNLRELHPSPTGSLLLTIPGLLSLFIARPREHALATYFFFGIRATVGASALLAYAAALLLTVGPQPQNLLESWRILTFLSWGCVIMLLISYFSLEPVLDLWDQARTAMRSGDNANEE